MPSSHSTPHVNNPFAAPALPEYVLSFEQRRARFGKLNPAHTTGKGTKRRHRREVDTKQGMEHTRKLLAGEVTFKDREGSPHSLRDLLASDLREAPVWLRDLQRQSRRYLDAVVTHGPASGWGIAQPVAGSERNPKWTPYVVPKLGEKCWRFWRSARLTLARLLPKLARWIGLTVPPHRPASEGTATKERQESGSKEPRQEETRCRDRSSESLAAVLDRVQRRFGM